MSIETEEYIAFKKVSQPYGWLGNMAPYAVTYETIEYKTTEALFQALRFKGFPEIQKKIRAEKSPMSAKMVAKSHIDLIPDYDFCKGQDIENMKLCLKLKVEQHPELVEMLLATNNKKLIEDCSSRPHGSGLKWGAALQEDKWVGENILGVLWEELREELKLSLEHSNNINKIKP